MNIDQATPKRQKRTITLHLGNTLAEYEATYLTETGLKALIRRVESADSLDWGCLATRQAVPGNYSSLTTIVTPAGPNTLTETARRWSLSGSAVWIVALSFRSNHRLSSVTNVMRRMRPRS